MTAAAYYAIADEAEAIGWPLRRHTDLTEHDLFTCLDLPASAAFVWAVFEAGTVLLVASADLDACDVESKLACLDRLTAGRVRLFYYEAGDIEPMADAEQAAWRLNERVRDMREADRVATRAATILSLPF